MRKLARDGSRLPVPAATLGQITSRKRRGEVLVACVCDPSAISHAVAGIFGPTAPGMIGTSCASTDAGLKCGC
ncbi:MAG: hypothetical protein AB7G76_11720 [Steroidobacteraceae bacterium]